MASRPGSPWNDAELKLLRDAIAAGLPRREVQHMIPTRSPGAVHDRYLRERRSAGVAPARAGRPVRNTIPMTIPANVDGIAPTEHERVARNGIIEASRELLRAMLRYGLRHGGLPGLSMAQIRVRAERAEA